MVYTQGMIDRERMLGLAEGLTESQDAKWVRIFDSLKSKQDISIEYSSVMGRGGGKRDFKVGRRGKDKKGRWWSEKITLVNADGSKPSKMSQLTLWKSRKGDKISLSIGNMAATIKDLEKK